MSLCQYYQHREISAAKNLREILRIFGDARGSKYHWTIKNKIRLVGWLRKWRREVEADEMQAEIDKVTTDGIDEIGVEGQDMVDLQSKHGLSFAYMGTCI
jgi:hypothetical protein